MNRRAIAARVLIVAAIWTLLHGYLWHRLFVSLPGQPGSAAAMLTLALLPFAALLTSRRDHGPLTSIVSWLGFTALALSSLLTSFVLITDVLFVRAWVDPQTVTVLVGGSALALIAAGVLRARYPAVVTIHVPIENLQPDLDGFRIAQISDLHVSGTLGRRFVERVVSTVNALAPDVIALTGDVADAFPQMVGADIAPLSQLRAADGKFFVTGNHEYFWDAPAWVEEVRRLGFDPLMNAHRVIERGDARLLIAGVTDGLAGAGLPGHRSDPRTAVSGAPPADVRVLLAHQPVSAFAAEPVGFDLQISGHTHGGQYFPFNLLIRLFQPFVSGLHRVGTMWLYVSRGTGYWGPPVRLGAPPEITLLVLTRTVPRAEPEGAWVPLHDTA